MRDAELRGWRLVVAIVLMPVFIPLMLYLMGKCVLFFVSLCLRALFGVGWPAGVRRFCALLGADPQSPLTVFRQKGALWILLAGALLTVIPLSMVVWGVYEVVTGKDRREGWALTAGGTVTFGGLLLIAFLF